MMNPRLLPLLIRRVLAALFPAGSGVEAVAGPYSVAATEVFCTGAAAGEVFCTGAAAGEVFSTGALIGQGNAN